MERIRLYVSKNAQAHTQADANSGPNLQSSGIRVTLSRIRRNTVNLKMNAHTADGVTVLQCNGRVVFGEESTALRDKVKSLLAEGNKRIVLNLGGVSYIDSGGLGVLVSLFTSAKAAGGEESTALRDKVKSLLAEGNK